MRLDAQHGCGAEGRRGVTRRKGRETAVAEAVAGEEIARVALLEKRSLATDDALRRADDRAARDNGLGRVEANLAQTVVTR